MMRCVPAVVCHMNDTDDFAKAVPFKSDIQMIIILVNVWCVNTNYGLTGLTVKLAKIRVKPPKGKSNVCAFTYNLFVDVRHLVQLGFKTGLSLHLAFDLFI